MSDQTVEQLTGTVVASLKRASGWWLVRAAISIIIGIAIIFGAAELVDAMKAAGGV